MPVSQPHRKQPFFNEFYLFSFSHVACHRPLFLPVNAAPPMRLVCTTSIITVQVYSGGIKTWCSRVGATFLVDPPHPKNEDVCGDEGGNNGGSNNAEFPLGSP